MLKKIIFTVSFILISLYGMAQKDLNNYKYIIVPKSFEISDGEDQYQLNSLLKFLFNKYGYEAYFSNGDLPSDLKTDRCLALISDVAKEKGGVFKTKFVITLKDCFGNTVTTSQIGESREKEFKKAYTEAVRNAFETFQNLDYKYVSKENKTVKSSDPVVESVKQKTTKVVAPKKVTAKVVEVVEVDKTETKIASTTNDFSGLHYAQEIDNGYQLVNSEPRIVMVLLETAAQNVFIVKEKSAIVFKQDGFWYYSENDGELGEQISIDIKF